MAACAAGSRLQPVSPVASSVSITPDCGVFERSIFRRIRERMSIDNQTPHLNWARGAPRRRIVGGALLFLIAAVALTAGITLVHDQPSAAAPIYVPTDRAVKLKLLDQRSKPPQLLIFGGSRATRFEPSYLQTKTGLRGFNLALQNGRPEDAWAFLNVAHELHPSTPLHIVWFVHVEAFRGQGLSVGVVQEPRLARWFPESMLDAARAKLPRTAAEAPKGNDLKLTTFGPDGVVLQNRYDIAVARGRTLKRALAWSTGEALERYAATPPALDPRSMEYFEKTLELAQRLGIEPVIVFMPLHPRLLAAVRDAGWEERHTEVIAYLDDLQHHYRFTTLDFSDLRSVHGDPSAYYDGFHVKRSLARRLIDATVAAAPAAFR